MTLQELIQALGFTAEESQDKIDILTKEFNSYTNSLSASKKTIKKLETSQAELQDIVDKYNTVKSAFELDEEAEDFDAMLDTVKDNLMKAGGGESTPEEIKMLKRDLTKANREKEKALKQFSALTAQYNEEKSKRIKSNIRNEVSKALADNNVIKPNQMIELFTSRVKVDEDESTFTIEADDGSELSIADYISDWSKDNPEFVKAKSKGGFGSGGNGGTENKPPKTEVDNIMDSLLKNNSNNNQDDKSLEELFIR